jgi:hypothetical protein
LEGRGALHPNKQHAMQQFKQSSMQQFKQAVSFDLMFKQPFKVQAVHLIV